MYKIRNIPVSITYVRLHTIVELASRHLLVSECRLGTGEGLVDC
jgi:hypothetical protein